MRILALLAILAACAHAQVHPHFGASDYPVNVRLDQWLSAYDSSLTFAVSSINGKAGCDLLRHDESVYGPIMIIPGGEHSMIASAWTDTIGRVYVYYSQPSSLDAAALTLERQLVLALGGDQRATAWDLRRLCRRP